MDGWIVDYYDRRMDRWMMDDDGGDGWKDRQMDGLWMGMDGMMMDGWRINVWIDRQMGGWMDGMIDGWMDC